MHITYVREPCNYVCIHIIWQCRKSNNIYIHYSNFKTQIPAGWHAHLVLSVSQGCPLPQGRRWSPRIFWFKNDLWRHKEINKTLIAGLAGDSKHCDPKKMKDDSTTSSDSSDYCGRPSSICANLMGCCCETVAAAEVACDCVPEASPAAHQAKSVCNSDLPTPVFILNPWPFHRWIMIINVNLRSGRFPVCFLHCLFLPSRLAQITAFQALSISIDLLIAWGRFFGAWALQPLSGDGWFLGQCHTSLANAYCEFHLTWIDMFISFLQCSLKTHSFECKTVSESMSITEISPNKEIKKTWRHCTTGQNLSDLACKRTKCHKPSNSHRNSRHGLPHPLTQHDVSLQLPNRVLLSAKAFGRNTRIARFWFMVILPYFSTTPTSRSRNCSECMPLPECDNG